MLLAAGLGLGSEVESHSRLTLVDLAGSDEVLFLLVLLSFFSDLALSLLLPRLPLPRTLACAPSWPV